MLELINYLITNLPEDAYVSFEKVKLGTQKNIEAIQLMVGNRQLGKAYVTQITYEMIQNTDTQLAKIFIHEELEKILARWK